MVKFVEKLPTENVMIVDALNLAFRWKHSGALVFVNDYISTVDSLAKSYKCGTIIIAADKGKSWFRMELFPEYKGNRQKLRDKQTEKEKKEFKHFFEECNELLKELEKRKSYIVLQYDNVEADDIAAYVVETRKDYGFNQVWLISSDRDWDLLIEKDVHRFSYVTRKEQTLLTWDNPVSIEEYLSYKVLVGDAGDNIPGIPQIGPKRATELIKQYGSALDLYANLPIDSRYKYIQNLNENADQILINQELMDLRTHCREAIGEENLKDIGRRLIF